MSATRVGRQIGEWVNYGHWDTNNEHGAGVNNVDAGIVWTPREHWVDNVDAAIA